MRGPIDYIIVGFEGLKFDGSILKSLEAPLKNGVIKLVALSAVSRGADDNVVLIDIAQTEDDTISAFLAEYTPEKSSVDKDDLDEVAELIEKNCTAGILVVEQLWAKPLKKALIDANGVLLGEGRIHPEALAELESN